MFSPTEDSHLIEEANYSGIIVPSAEWHTLEWRGGSGGSGSGGSRGSSSGGSRIAYRVRVRCDANYYNTTCTTFCRPRDDAFGHYTCGQDGDKRCLPGWRGDTCEKRKLYFNLLPNFYIHHPSLLVIPFFLLSILSSSPFYHSSMFSPIRIFILPMLSLIRYILLSQFVFILHPILPPVILLFSPIYPSFHFIICQLLSFYPPSHFTSFLFYLPFRFIFHTNVDSIQC